MQLYLPIARSKALITQIRGPVAKVRVQIGKVRVPVAKIKVQIAKTGLRGAVALGVAFIVVGVGAAMVHPASPAETLSTAGQPASATQAAAPVAKPAISAPALSRTFRVGIQAGHWLNSGLPDELAVLKGSTGAQGNGWREVDVNLDIARRVVALLSQAGVQADLLPATVPVDYRADAFVALHGDASSSPSASGYKAARSDWSIIPGKDDALMKDITSQYQTATGLKYDPGTITYAMKRYYVFNNHRYLHTVDQSTPSVILEMGFLTNPQDRALLVNYPETAAEAIARGILNYLSTQG